MASIALIEDDELVRAGLADWLATIPGVTVVSVAGSADEAFTQFAATLPNLALIDVLLPGVSGIELVRKIRARWPSVHCVMLSGANAPELVLDSFESGARGYLTKVTSAGDLSRAIQEVLAGRSYISPVLTGPVIEKSISMRTQIRSQETPGCPQQELTDRDRELLKLIAEGHSSTEIASRLGLSTRTIERLKGKLEEKVHAHSLADFVKRAVTLGLVSR